MKKVLSILLILFSIVFLIQCKKNSDWRLKMIKYTDSTYAQKVDSLFIIDVKTVYYNKKFELTGYFKYLYHEGSYDLGKLKQGTQIGKWRSYNYHYDSDSGTVSSKLFLTEENNYNQKGDLDGRYISYNSSTKKVFECYKYSNGKMVGEQKIFYPNDDLFSSYHQDGKGNYIDQYIVYKPNKDTLYYQNFGSEGTGYLKIYQIKLQKILQEGMIINKKQDGLFKEYSYTWEDGDTTQIRKQKYILGLLKQQTTIYKTKWYDEINKTYIDSTVSVYYGKNDSHSNTKWYYKGKLIQEKEDYE